MGPLIREVATDVHQCSLVKGRGLQINLSARTPETFPHWDISFVNQKALCAQG